MAVCFEFLKTLHGSPNERFIQLVSNKHRTTTVDPDISWQSGKCKESISTTENATVEEAFRPISLQTGKNQYWVFDTAWGIFEFPNSDIKVISQLFNSAKEDVYDYQSYARQLRSHFSEQKVLEEILNALFAIAYADKVLHENEERMLIEISKIFGVDKKNYDRLKSVHENKNFSSNHEKLKRCYNLLGVEETDSLESIKKKYREIIKNYHPDKIQGKGLPKDFVDFANKKLTDFNEAYNEIKKSKK